ncbi:hypothetical protein QJQ45_023217 [Haematococcus lacustris]|nr:hypothetical protein QJQ45_023217 [Haematococcus lacustris]
MHWKQPSMCWQQSATWRKGEADQGRPPCSATGPQAQAHPLTVNKAASGSSEGVQPAACSGTLAPSSSNNSHSLTHSALQFLEQVCSRHLLPLTPPRPPSAGQAGQAPVAAASSSLLLALLPCLALPLRTLPYPASPHSLAPSLPHISCLWMSHCLSLPPVIWEEGSRAVQPLQVVLACFPMPLSKQGSKCGQGSQSSIDGLGVGPSGQRHGSVGRPGAPLLLLDPPGCTAEEQALLVKLLRHQAVRQVTSALVRGAAQDGGSPSLAPATTQNDLPPACIVSQLELAAASYAWPILGAAEWSTVLRDTLATLTAAVTDCRSLACRAAAATRSAAAQVLGQKPGAVSGAMAAKLLAKLSERGLLTQQAAAQQLADDWHHVVLDAWQFDMAKLSTAAHTVGVLLALAQHANSLRMDVMPAGLRMLRQEYWDQVCSACEQLVQLLAVQGVVQALGQLAGASITQAISSWCLGRGASGAWQVVGWVVSKVMAAAGKAGAGGLAGVVLAGLTTTDSWLVRAECDAGCDVVEGLLGLALQPLDCHPLAGAAYTSLLHAPASLLARLSTPGSPVAAYLIAAGLSPVLASAIAPSADQRLRSAPTTDRGLADLPLAAWSLLLAHLAATPDGAAGTALLRQALREIPEVVPRLLDRLLPCLPLEQFSPGAKSGSSKNTATAGQPGAVLAHDALKQLRAAGLPYGRSASRTVGRAVFGAVLHQLPASSRTWFSDIRDRGVATAVEAYTAARESPALIAAEITDIHSRSQELNSDKFTVKVLVAGMLLAAMLCLLSGVDGCEELLDCPGWPAAGCCCEANALVREVVATMEIEETASVELVIRLPLAMPLKPPEVECRRKLGVNDMRLRKWLLSISAFLRTNNQGVAQALSMWRSNLESEFAGVEPCIICYSVVAATNSALPRLQCRTCQASVQSREGGVQAVARAGGIWRARYQKCCLANVCRHAARRFASILAVCTSGSRAAARVPARIARARGFINATHAAEIVVPRIAMGVELNLCWRKKLRGPGVALCGLEASKDTPDLQSLPSVTLPARPLSRPPGNQPALVGAVFFFAVVQTFGF